MSNELMKYSDQTFEDIKHINEDGQEFWYARELQHVLEYAQWRYMKETVERARLAKFLPPLQFPLMSFCHSYLCLLYLIAL